MQPDFTAPDFMDNSSAEEIHERMMENLPDDIDDMPGGFPFDFTMPAALEKAELLQYHMTRALMVAFPQYAWDEWLDLHGKQVHLVRHEAEKASGTIDITGLAGTEIAAGTVFCTPATESGPSLEFAAEKTCVIGEDGKAEVGVTALEGGTMYNVKANAVSLMTKPVKGITEASNPEPMKGGTDRENNDDYYDRIAAEYENSRTYLGNDGDYIRWAKEAGAGACIVVSAPHGPGTVKLVLVDPEGRPASEKLVQEVYDYIVSPSDRDRRLLPTACAELECVAASTVPVSYVCTGILHDHTTDMEQIRKEFSEAVRKVYTEAKQEGVLRYNDVRPLISAIHGVEDFDTFLINGAMENISIPEEEYPETGTITFSQEKI